MGEEERKVQHRTARVQEAQQAAAAAEYSIESAQAFWTALEKSRQDPPNAPLNNELQKIRALEARRKEAQRRVEADSRSLQTIPTVPQVPGRCCALFVNGTCPFTLNADGSKADSCPRGSHQA